MRAQARLANADYAGAEQDLDQVLRLGHLELPVPPIIAEWIGANISAVAYSMLSRAHSNIEPYYDRAHARLRLGKWADAEADLTCLINGTPEEIAAARKIAELARIYQDKAGNLGLARHGRPSDRGANRMFPLSPQQHERKLLRAFGSVGPHG